MALYEYCIRFISRHVVPPYLPFIFIVCICFLQPRCSLMMSGRCQTPRIPWEHVLTVNKSPLLCPAVSTPQLAPWVFLVEAHDTTTSFDLPTTPSTDPLRATISDTADLIQLVIQASGVPCVMFLRKPTIFQSRMHFMGTCRSERWPLAQKADFERPNLAVRLYNQLELLGFPKGAELAYIAGE